MKRLLSNMQQVHEFLLCSTYIFALLIWTQCLKEKNMLCSATDYTTTLTFGNTVNNFLKVVLHPFYIAQNFSCL